MLICLFLPYSIFLLVRWLVELDSLGCKPSFLGFPLATRHGVATSTFHWRGGFVPLPASTFLKTTSIYLPVNITVGNSQDQEQGWA